MNSAADRRCGRQKCRRASAYPASESKKTRPTVTHTVTITEFMNHSGKSAWRSVR